jgi:ATP-dependent DNA helicase RecG
MPVGGEIAVGIEDRNQPFTAIARLAGFPRVEDYNFVHQVLVQQIDPPVPYPIDYLQVEGQEARGLVALVSVGKSPSVHRLIPSNDVWIRRGAQNLLLTGEQVTNLALAKGAASFEDQFLDRYTFDELMAETALATFLQDYGPSPAASR